MQSGRSSLLLKLALILSVWILYLPMIQGCVNFSSSDPDKGKCYLKIVNKSEVSADILISGKDHYSVGPGKTMTKQFDIGSEVVIKAGNYQEKFQMTPDLQIPIIRSVEYEATLDSPNVPVRIIIAGNAASHFKGVICKTKLANKGSIESNFGGIAKEKFQQGEETANYGLGGNYTSQGANVTSINGYAFGPNDRAVLLGRRFVLSQKNGTNQPVLVSDIQAGTEFEIQSGSELEIVNGVAVDYSIAARK